MDFTVEKDPGTIPYVLSQILDTCINGITLSDPDQPDNPIVYANEAFERMCGYYEAADHTPVVVASAERTAR